MYAPPWKSGPSGPRRRLEIGVGFSPGNLGNVLSSPDFLITFVAVLILGFLNYVGGRSDFGWRSGSPLRSLPHFRPGFSRRGDAERPGEAGGGSRGTDGTFPNFLRQSDCLDSRNGKGERPVCPRICRLNYDTKPFEVLRSRKA